MDNQTTVVEASERFVKKVEHSAILPEIKYGSRKLIDCINLALDVAPADHLTVLIEGETGVGKEKIAHLIHEQSPRRNKELVIVDCATLEENLILSDLFGHARGAFTGAERDKPGFFEIANGGSIFLDEIGELPKAVQMRLLRVLQEKTFNRLGETKVRRIDVRVIAATNKNLAEEVKKKNFRDDLYWRLAQFPVHIPPLRERSDDIMILACHFRDIILKDKLRVVSFSHEAIEAMKKYSWPGNVRELKNAVERALIRCEDEIFPKHLKLETSERRAGSDPKTKAESEDVPPLEALEKTKQERLRPVGIEEQFLQLSGAREFKEKFPGITLGVSSLAEAIQYVRVGHIRIHMKAAGGNISKAAHLANNEYGAFKERLKKIGSELANSNSEDPRIEIGTSMDDVWNEIRERYSLLIYRFCGGRELEAIEILGIRYHSQYQRLKKSLCIDKGVITERDRQLFNKRKAMEVLDLTSLPKKKHRGAVGASGDVKPRKREDDNVSGLIEALEKNRWSLRATADVLHVSVSQLKKLIKEQKIKHPDGLWFGSWVKQ